MNQIHTPGNKEIDYAKLQLYNAYYSRHKELFRKNAQDYWFFARRFAEKGVEDWIYYHTEILEITKRSDGLEDIIR
ncbi:MAG: hypothetical protein V1743_01205 [Nanoarchaeota archaeon]